MNKTVVVLLGAVVFLLLLNLGWLIRHDHRVWVAHQRARCLAEQEALEALMPGASTAEFWEFCLDQGWP